jgi:hypothetical protein
VDWRSGLIENVISNWDHSGDFDRTSHSGLANAVTTAG